MAKKYTGNRKSEKNGSNDLLGYALIIVSAFILLCIVIPIILGGISAAVRSVILGVFGLFSYPLFLSVLLLGIALVKNFKVNVAAKYVVCISVMLFCALMILQLATSFMFIDDGFSAYISRVFSAKLTAGGVLFGVLAYGMQAGLSQVFTYILLSAGIIVSAVIMLDVFHRFGREKVEKSVTHPQPKPSFVKTDALPKMVRPVVDNSLYVGTIEKKPVSNVSTSGGSFSSLAPSDLQRPVVGNNFNDRPFFGGAENSFTSGQSKTAEAGVRPDGYDVSPSGQKLFDSYDSDSRKKTAREILFENNYAQYPGQIAPQNGGSPYAEPAQTLSGYGALKDEFDSEQLRRESIDSSIPTPTAAVSQPEIKKVVKPPKFVHAENEVFPKLEPVVYPAPKDFSDKIVGGEIINGDDLSQRLEEEKLKKEQTAKDEFAKFDFDRKKVEPATFRPIEKPEKSIYQAPIMNGDYFSAGRRQEENKQEENKSAAEENVVLDVKPAANPFMPGPKEDMALPNEQEPPVNRAPIINGDYNRPRTTLEQLIADEKALMNRNGDEIDGSPLFVKGTDGQAYAGFDSREADAKEKEDKSSTEDYITFEDDVVRPIEEATEPREEKSSAFNYVDEVEDLSEKTFHVDKDNTGYYQPVGYDSEVGGYGNEIRLDGYDPVLQPAETVREQPLKPQNQLKIEDVLAIKPEDKPKPKPKKKHIKYLPPPVDLLVCNSTDPAIFSGDSEEKARILESTLESLKLPAKVTAITSGPAVTRYELEMPPGISVRKIDACCQDIEYNLASNGKIRIETPIPGKRAVGIEVPNMEIATVALRDLIECKEFQNAVSPVTLAIGKDIAGSNIICNLEKMPHLLIAGATNSGKSACLNSIITSILYKASPEEVRLILIDPKEVEFRIYKDMPHLLIKDIINETDQAIRAFKWAKTEMDRRYKLLSQYCVRNIQEFNGSAYVKEGIEEKLPRIVIIVDELCELMMSANRKDLEDRIMSMAQKARAAGIHLILATQRPSVDVITGTIKANLPSRIAFAVASFNDSRTILDQGGAESLLGRGDMLYAPADMPLPKRVQGAYITSEEVASVVAYVKEHNSSDHDDSVEELIMAEEPQSGEGGAPEEDDEFDPLIKDVLRRVIETGQASTSMIQRRFSVGYARASRIIDQMEMHRFIGPLEGSNKPREVYITAEQFREIFGEDL